VKPRPRWAAVSGALLALAAWAPPVGAQGVSPEQSARCREGVVYMIEFGRKALDDPHSRPERTQKRRRLLDEWQSRLDRGEEPCEIYRDIHKSATTF